MTNPINPTQMSQENNKLIADFMGWQHHSSADYDAYEMNNLKYHTSFDWLMPVVEKILKIRMPFKGMIDVYSFETTYKSWDSPFHTTTMVIKCEPHPNGIEYIYHTISCRKPKHIESIYDAVIKFIKWYNSQNTPQ